MIQKLKAKLSFKRVMSLIGLVSMLVVVDAISVSAQSLTQGYATDDPIQRATIVSLVQDNPRKVEPSTFDNQERMHGVVVSKNDAPFALSTEDEQTFVATKGRFEVFVSNENGAVQTGDFISISRVSGIGMRSSENDLFVIGKALTGFDGEENVLSYTNIDDFGTDKKVAIGRIQVDVGVSGNPLFKPSKANLPTFLEKAAETIAGKSPVNPVRIYISLVELIVAAGVAGVLLYSGIRSAIISIGRNPLSKKSVTKSVLQVVFTSIIILMLGIFGVYLILRV